MFWVLFVRLLITALVFQKKKKKSNTIETQKKHAEENSQTFLKKDLHAAVWNWKTYTRELLFSEKEKQNETLRAALEQMKASTDSLSEEIQVFGSQIVRLTQENSVFFEQEEQSLSLRGMVEQMKASIEETEILVLRGITETNELELTSTLLQIEVEKL